MKGDMLDRCFAHIRSAARQGTMKGLDPEVMGHAFIAEAMISTWGVDPALAMQLTKHCIAYAAEFLHTINRQNVEATGGDLDAYDRQLQAATADRPPWMKTNPVVVAMVHEKLGRPDLFATTAVRVPD